MLHRWHESKVFERSLEQTAGGPPLGASTRVRRPPTAIPGAHHVEARVFKDLFPRFKTMKGYSVPRRAGWDCHGLPVELAVEKELGFTGKQDIEAYGVAEFNAKCRESVLRHVDEFERLTERMGYWTDMAHAYRTMDTPYIESVWWSLRQIFDKGLLVEDSRVAPYCPRCQTALSDHEVSLGYHDVVDPSVYVRFPLPSARAGATCWSGRRRRGPSSRTPRWPCIPEVSYVVGRRRHRARRNGPCWSPSRCSRRPSARTPRCWSASPGRDLEGLAYQRPFDLLPAEDFGEGAPPGRARRLRHRRRTAPGSCTRRRPSAPRTSPSPGSTACRSSTRSSPTARFARTSRSSAAPSSRRPTRRWSRSCAGAASCWRYEPYEHSYPLAGAATPRCSTTRCPPGTSARPQSRTGCSRRTSRPTGTRRGSSTAATASGCAATSTGRCPGTGTGARRCRSGGAPPTAATSPAWARWPNSSSSPARTSPRSTRTGPTWTR